MSNAAIFLPMLATMALTAVVWFYMYALRIPAMVKAGLKAQTYTTPDTVVREPQKPFASVAASVTIRPTRTPSRARC